MRRLVASTLLAAATAGAIAFGAPSALAAGTWTVDNSNVDGSFTGLLSSETLVRFTDSNTHISLECPSSSILGTARSGTGLTVPITAMTFAFSQCTGPLGSTAHGALSGTYGADSYDAMSGTTLGTVTGTSADLTIDTVSGSCKVNLTGDVSVNYANSGLLTAGTLELTAATVAGTGCAALVQVGDTVSLAGLYDVVPVITITSP